ncbi:MAG: type II toxin-antitoxin system RelE/ParE family toxin [Deltaproteobacteria bacterium]|nr:type II toxin-antitoxin system RelE/ParE family toxin [Deltaproteobacteria bacterium]
MVRFIETYLFTEDIEHELSLDEYRQLQLALLFRPAQGAVIQGSGGLRKMRWRRPGMGKRGGLRVIYYWEARSETFYMLTIYRKAARDDLTHEQTAILRRLVKEEFK